MGLDPSALKLGKAQQHSLSSATLTISSFTLSTYHLLLFNSLAIRARTPVQGSAQPTFKMHIFKRIKRKSTAPAAPSTSATNSSAMSYIDDDATTLAPSIAPAATDTAAARAALLATLAEAIFTTFRTIHRVHDTPREHVRDVAARLEALRDAVEACAAPDGAPPAGGREEGDGGPLAGAVGAAMRECERRVIGVRAGGLSLVGHDSFTRGKLGVVGMGKLDAARRRAEPIDRFAAVFRAVPLVEARG
jgi:hypothetical protein